MSLYFLLIEISAFNKNGVAPSKLLVAFVNWAIELLSKSTLETKTEVFKPPTIFKSLSSISYMFFLASNSKPYTEALPTFKYVNVLPPEGISVLAIEFCMFL